MVWSASWLGKGVWDISYVARVLNLTTLAPEIVEAILDDALPDATFLNDIAINPPLLWTSQHSVSARNSNQ